jgi:hypothetical protein
MKLTGVNVGSRESIANFASSTLSVARNARSLVSARIANTPFAEG